MPEIGQGRDEGLVCVNLCAGWDDTQVLSGISFRLPPGKSLAVLGRNGVGKSTLLSTIIGRATFRSGTLRYRGRPIERQPTYERARNGIGLVPQEREIFGTLSVHENLMIAHRKSDGMGTEWTLPRIYELFPQLWERQAHRGTQLSGGEQQMLSIARALMGNPSLLLMDEPMEGLAPVIVDQLALAVHRIRAETRMAILLVEQHVDIALEFTSNVLVLDRGAIVYDQSDGSAEPDRPRIENLIGVSA
jgi:branched-chain amino acid transport system ATP-binding protein